MLKKFRTKELELSRNGTSEIERMLAVMPKYCTCTACTNFKEEAKAKLGKSKYNLIANATGIVE